MEINGETLMWETADGTLEARHYSDVSLHPRHFKEAASHFAEGNYYLVLDKTVDIDDHIYGDAGYLIEVVETDDDYLYYRELHIDRDEPTSDPIENWQRKFDNDRMIRMEEV